MSEFTGFKPATLNYLKALGANNDKTWFTDNRAAYEAHYLEPAKAFVTAVTAPLTAIAPHVHCEPRVNGSIFRINRDIRFSKDKTPYKDHIDLWFWEGQRKGAVSGFFFRLTAKDLILGAGAHMMAADRLKAFRAKVADDASRASLVKAIRAVEKKRLPIEGAHYARLPRGCEAADADAERLLRHNAIWTSTSAPHPKSLGTSAFVDHCIAVWRDCAPLHRWLIDELGTNGSET